MASHVSHFFSGFLVIPALPYANHDTDYSDDFRGVGLASRLVTYQRHRFYGIVTVAVSYVEPGLVWDIGTSLCMQSNRQLPPPA